MKNLLSIAVILLLLISSCRKNETKEKTCNTEGNVYFCLEIDGELTQFSCIVAYVEINVDDTVFNYWIINGTNNNDNRNNNIQELFQMTSINSEESTYENTVTVSFTYNNGNYSNYNMEEPKYDAPFTLIINKSDLENQILEGEFFGELYDIHQDKSIEITNGIFSGGY